jgi:hypothetical protein
LNEKVKNDEVEMIPAGHVGSSRRDTFAFGFPAPDPAWIPMKPSPN